MFYAVLLLVNYLLLELVSYGLYRVKFGEYAPHALQLERVQTIEAIESGPVFTGENQDADKDKRSDKEAANGKRVKEILHPYVGYTVEGREAIEGCEPKDPNSAYECWRRILRPEDQAMPKRSPDKLNVALLGGSVAVGTVNGVNRAYQRMLGRLPEYQGRQVVLHMLAAGGYRQPQPLMMLNYYQTLGAEYDLIIALDGFNEIAIAGTEYKRNKIHPSFPRSWKFRVLGKVGPELLQLQAQKLLLEQQHRQRTVTMSNAWLRNSPLSNLVWKIVNARYQTNAAQVVSQLANLQQADDVPEEFLFEGIGPNYAFSDWDQLISYTTQMWANSTLLVHGAAQVSGAQFFHFIQPNQYIEGAKPIMSPAERRVAISPPGRGGYGNWYKKGYPFLHQQHLALKQQGVNTTDLTYMFKDNPDDLYIDNCCHLNSKGSDLIVKKIAETIHQYNISQSESVNNHE